MSKKYLVTGASGLLGQALVPYLASAGEDVYAVCHTRALVKADKSVTEVHCDLRNQSEISGLLDETLPDVFIHTAGLTSVDGCETDPQQAFLLNTEIPQRLAEWCHINEKRFVFISSDHVTAGQTPFFIEESPVGPVNVYARTKADAERAIMQIYPAAQIIRTNFFGHGPVWRTSLTDWLWDKANASETIPAFTDSYFSPLSVHYLSKAIYDLSQKNDAGIFHAGGAERLSKYDFAMRFVDFFGFDRDLVRPSLMADAHLSAPRPADMSMSVRKIEKTLGWAMPTIMESFQSIKPDYRQGTKV